MAKVKLTIGEPEEATEQVPEVAAEAPAKAKEAPSTPKPKPKTKVAPAEKPAGSKAAAKDVGSAKPAGEATQAKSVRGVAKSFSKFAPGHENAVLGGIVGLVVAILMFAIGFWHTLFVSVMVAAGVALGQYLDGDPRIVNLIRRIIAEFRGN